MSRKLKAVEQTKGQPEASPEFSEELPALRVDPTSFDARAAGVEPCSVVREISKHWSAAAAYELEQEIQRGEMKSPEGAKTYDERWEAEQALTERKRELWLRKWEPRPDEELEEHIKYIKRKAARFVDWGDIGRLWNSSPRDAIEAVEGGAAGGQGRVRLRPLRGAGLRGEGEAPQLVSLGRTSFVASDNAARFADSNIVPTHVRPSKSAPGRFPPYKGRRWDGGVWEAGERVLYLNSRTCVACGPPP